MRRIVVPALWLVAFILAAPAWCSDTPDIAADKPLLLRHPAISRTRIVFTFANDLWSVGREGGSATRLTTGAGAETDPVFSPDGSQIAFTGEYDGNVDVFVMPAAGGIPKRLTYHPAPDRAIGWTPDGKNILFASNRNSYSGFSRLFTVPAEGGFETQLPLDRHPQRFRRGEGPARELERLQPDVGRRYRLFPFRSRRRRYAVRI